MPYRMKVLNTKSAQRNSSVSTPKILVFTLLSFHATSPLFGALSFNFRMTHVAYMAFHPYETGGYAVPRAVPNHREQMRVTDILKVVNHGETGAH